MTTQNTTLLDEYQSLLESAAKGGSESTTTIRSLSWSMIGRRDETHDADYVYAKENSNGATAEEATRLDSIALDSITPADTLIVTDMQIDFLPGGAFGVAEGDSCIDGICELVTKFHQAGATVIATRDYHPSDHCSFISQGGPFPDHCVQGTKGSFFHPKIASALQPLLAVHYEKSGSENESNGTNGTSTPAAARASKQTTHVVYKAFSRDVDSFGGFPYVHCDNNDSNCNEESNDNSLDKDEDWIWKQRLSHSANCSHGTCHLEWTGAYHLYASNLVNDANAPPDVMSVLEKRPVSDLLPEASKSRPGRTFVCGLAYDFCVIDSAVNYCEYAKTRPHTLTDHCFIIQDLVRAAHIPGYGQHGSGFLTDPKVMLDKLKRANIGLMRFVD